MSVVVIGLSRNLVYKILDQDNGKIMRTWGGSRCTWVTNQQITKNDLILNSTPENWL